MSVRSGLAFFLRTWNGRMLLGMLVVLVVLVVGIGVWVSQPLFSAGEPATATVSADILRAHVQKLSVDFAPRSCENKYHLTLCADYIRKHFQDAGAAVSSQEYTADSATYENLIARFGPASGPRVIVGAHYDACGSTPGADDNASGVAGLLELARLLGAAPAPPALRVDLVAYCTEEPPHFAGTGMGSYQHAQSLSNENVAVKAMLCLEMIGYFSDEPWSQSYPLRALYCHLSDERQLHRRRGQWPTAQLLVQVKHAMSGATDLPVFSAAMPMWVPGVDFSDHRSYWQFDYPAVMITDMAFYRNTAYHTARDTHDRLDYAAHD